MLKEEVVTMLVNRSLTPDPSRPTFGMRHITHCQVCCAPLEGEWKADFRDIYGRWGVGCIDCFIDLGRGIGIGLAQVFDESGTQRICK